MCFFPSSLTVTRSMKISPLSVISLIFRYAVLVGTPVSEHISSTDFPFEIVDLIITLQGGSDIAFKKTNPISLPASVTRVLGATALV